MSDSLIEQVRAMALALDEVNSCTGVAGAAYDRKVAAWQSAAENLDAKALLAHMQAQQAVVDAARKLDLDREDNNDGRAVGHWDASAEDALNAALNAALEKVNDHEQ